MTINPLILAASITMDSVVLGKQKSFSIIPLMLFASFFHVGALALGLSLGGQLTALIGHFDHWLAFAVFGLLGASCFKDFLVSDESSATEAHSWLKLIFISLALSIDAAAVGATSQAIISDRFAVLLSVAILSAFFVFIGKKLSHFLHNRNELFLKLLEGVLFWSIGISILISHISGGF